MYRGTQMNFRANYLPKFKAKKVDPITDYTIKKKKVYEIKREDVIKGNVLNNIIEYVNNQEKTEEVESFGTITYIESNLKGANLFKDIEHSFMVTVNLFSKPIVKTKKVSNNKDKTK